MGYSDSVVAYLSFPKIISEYALEISKDLLGWRVGIHPSRPDLPILSTCSFTVHGFYVSF
jgi:hypothetical protein